MGHERDSGTHDTHSITPNLELGKQTHDQIPRRQNKYVKFGDDYELFSSNIRTQTNVEAEAQSHNSFWEASQVADEAGSDKEIMQVKTVKVTYGEPVQNPP